MAKIVKADGAPDGTVRVIYTGGDFEVSGRGYKTDDPDQVAAAAASPFLEVQDSSTPPESDVDADPSGTTQRIERDNEQKAEVAAAREGDPEAAPAPEPTPTPKRSKS